MVIILIGVAGAGKTTIGRALAAELGWRFVEGDDYHSAGNIEKMRAGVPLTDADRAPWLLTLAHLVGDAVQRREGMVMSCSALKERYRVILRDEHRGIRFVYLEGDEPIFRQRLARRGHFFGPDLIPSQLATLEEPHDPRAISVDASLPPEEILNRIRVELGV